MVKYGNERGAHMEWDIDGGIAEILESFRKMSKDYAKELSKCRDGYMIRIPSKGGTYSYAEVRKVRNKYIKRGITKNRDAIFSHSRKRLLKEVLKVLELNIGALEMIKDIYKPLNINNIIQNLPKSYSELPIEAFFSPKGKTKWETENYPQNPAFPEHLKHVTLRGFKVRSKSELYIASQLDRYHIPYRYEMEIWLSGRKYYPDFTILNQSNGQYLYWEHCGMVNNKEYMSSHFEKMRIYYMHDIVPWKNLIVTYDDLEGNISAKDIDGMIQGLLYKTGRIVF